MKNRKQKAVSIALLFTVAMSTVSITGCGTTIQPGHVGIVIDKFGQNRGVQDYPVRTGWVSYNPFSSSIVEYPTYMQTIKWTRNPHEGGLNDKGGPEDESITFTTKESVSVNVDVSLGYQLDDKLIPAFYVKFRSDDLGNFTYGYLHNITRDAMMEVGGHYTVEDVMGNNEAFIHEVRDRIKTQMTPIGVEVQQFGFIGAPRPPESVVEAINRSQQAKYLSQQKENELAQAKADAMKRVAAAEGEATANTRLTQSLTPQVLEFQRIQLQRQQLEVQDRWINRWDGRVPQVTAGGGSNMLYTLPTQQK